MRIVIIGGTGHIGTFLVPRLVSAGYEVVSVSRQKRAPYQSHPAWNLVKQMAMDRVAPDEKKLFGKQILALKPDVVIDMICYTQDQAQDLVEALHGRVQHLLCAGTIWVHGRSGQVPADETQPRRPLGTYGIHKAACESYLLSAARQTGFPVTVLHPGHLVGPGWAPLNPAGNFNPEVFKKLARGEEVILPNLGLETLHHVHADDVAHAFVQAINNRDRVAGESFHIVSERALTLREYAKGVAAWFGQEARLKFLPWEKWKDTASESDARATWDHITHSSNCSIAKARKLMDYQPRYSSLQAVREAVKHLFDNDYAGLQ